VQQFVAKRLQPTFAGAFLFGAQSVDGVHGAQDRRRIQATFKSVSLCFGECRHAWIFRPWEATVPELWEASVPAHGKPVTADRVGVVG
jgi:hypothetical protein